MHMLLTCGRNLKVYVHIQLACVRRPMYAHAYSCLKTLIQVFCFCSFFYFTSYVSVFTFLYDFFTFLFLCSHVCLSLYDRLWFSLKVLALMLCHSFTCPFINAIGVVMQ